MTSTSPTGQSGPERTVRDDSAGEDGTEAEAGNEAEAGAETGGDAPERTATAKERAERTLSRTKLAHAVAVTLRQAIRILRWPTALLLLVPVVPILGTAWIATRTTGSDLVIVALLLLAGGGVTLAWAIRRHSYRRAVRDVDALAAEFRSLLEPSLVTDEALDLIRKVAAKGGILLLRRLRAVWSLMTFPEHVLDQSKGYPRARWFVPPTIATSGILLTAHLWVVALSWPIFLTLAVLLATGLIGS